MPGGPGALARAGSPPHARQQPRPPAPRAQKNPLYLADVQSRRSLQESLDPRPGPSPEAPGSGPSRQGLEIEEAPGGHMKRVVTEGSLWGKDPRAQRALMVRNWSQQGGNWGLGAGARPAGGLQPEGHGGAHVYGPRGSGSGRPPHPPPAHLHHPHRRGSSSGSLRPGSVPERMELVDGRWQWAGGGAAAAAAHAPPAESRLRHGTLGSAVVAGGGGAGGGGAGGGGAGGS